MLHNLLPKTQKTQLRNEYLIRLTGIALFLCSSAIMVGAVSLIPSYVSVSTAVSDLEEQILKQNESQEDKPLTILAHTSQSLSVLRNKVSAEPMTDLLVPVLNARSEGIQITSISFDRETLSFSLRGIAANRDALVTYRRTVEGLDRVSEVTSPIANLARNINLEFTLTVVLAKPESA